MRIAIIGGGISGLTTAHLLCGEHEITLFEGRDRASGELTRTGTRIDLVSGSNSRSGQ